MNAVKFMVGTSEEFKALEYKDPLCLYFTLDDRCFYRGNVLMGSGNIDNLKQSEDITLSWFGGSASEIIKEEDNDN